MVASRTVLVRIRADADQFNREVVTSTGSMRKLGDESDQTGKSIDRLSGRVRLFGELAGVLGPGLTPILGATSQAAAGLATQIGFSVLAAGSAIIAFQGMGDALKALSDARLDPTTANLAKAQAAMERLSPAGQDLARTISGLADEWEQTKAIAQGGLFPGVESSIDSMMTRLPELQQILATVSTTAGDLLAEGADSLASDRWDGLFNYLDTRARPILTDTAHTAGDLTHALSELIIAMDPLTRDFTAGLANAADDFDKWATGLSQTEGFAEFVDYMRTEGPHVAETVGDIAGALASIVEASAGAGSVSLDFLQLIATTVRTIADSPVGPVLVQLIQLVSTMALLSRAWTMFSTGGVATFVQGQQQAVGALATTISAQQRATMSTSQLAAAQRELSATQKAAVGTLGRGAAGIAGMGLAALSTQKHVVGLGAASGALMGFAAGGPWGAAIGGAIGLLGDLSMASQASADETEAFTATLDQNTGAITENSRAWAAHEIGADTLAKLQQAGLNTADLTTALLDGGDAWAAYRAQIEAAFPSGTQGGRGYRSSALALLGDLDEIAGTIDDGKASFQLYAGAVEDTGAAFDNATPEVTDFTTAVAELNGILDKRAAWRAYQASIDDARKALKENGQTLDANTAKGRDNADRLDTMIERTMAYAGTLNFVDRQAFLTEARRGILDMAEKMGASRKQLAEYRHDLQILNGTQVDISVVTHYKSTHDTGMNLQPAGHATGGLVRGPGSRTSDSIPTLLSDYEYVQRAAAVDHYGVGFMDAVNDLRFPKHAPAVQPFTGGSGSGGGRVGSDDVIRQELRLTREELRDLKRVVATVAPAATGRAIVDRLNHGAASEMRTADL
jgi:hypothetical protein